MCVSRFEPQGLRSAKTPAIFEILLAKIFSLRQKANEILSATFGKIKFDGGGHEF